MAAPARAGDARADPEAGRGPRGGGDLARRGGADPAPGVGGASPAPPSLPAPPCGSRHFCSCRKPPSPAPSRAEVTPRSPPPPSFPPPSLPAAAAAAAPVRARPGGIMADGVDHIDIYADVGEEFNQVRAGRPGPSPPFLFLRRRRRRAACRPLSEAAGPGRAAVAAAAAAAAIVRPATAAGLFPPSPRARIGAGDDERRQGRASGPAGPAGVGGQRRPRSLRGGCWRAGRGRGRGAPGASAFPFSLLFPPF